MLGLTFNRAGRAVAGVVVIAGWLFRAGALLVHHLSCFCFEEWD
jgi:hypothetical protein